MLVFDKRQCGLVRTLVCDDIERARQVILDASATNGSQSASQSAFRSTQRQNLKSLEGLVAIKAQFDIQLFGPTE